MFKPILKGLAVNSLMVSCLSGVAYADTQSCADSNFMACDVTMLSPISTALTCGVSTPLIFTLTNSLPVSVPYTYTVTPSSTPVTYDPLSTCGATILAPGTCTLILDATPACPATGNLIFTLTVIPGTTQAPLVATINDTVTGILPVNILGAAADCAILAGSSITNTGPSLVTGGDVCIAPGTSVTGWLAIDGGPGIVAPPGAFEIDTVTATNAQSALLTAIGTLEGMACTSGPLGPTDLAGDTLPTGVYCYSTTAQISTGGTLTLNGTATDLFVFLVGSQLTINNGAKIVLTGGAQAGNVYFVEGTEAVIGTGVAMQGNIITETAQITIATGSSLIGRALANDAGAGAVTLEDNAITAPPH